MKSIILAVMASLLAFGTAVMAQSPVPGSGGNKYVPYEERTGHEPIVYFTRNLSAEGLLKAYTGKRPYRRKSRREVAYILIGPDNGGKRITAAEAVRGLKPIVQE